MKRIQAQTEGMSMINPIPFLPKIVWFGILMGMFCLLDVAGRPDKFTKAMVLSAKILICGRIGRG